jgi:ferredoxin-NADP reductase
MAFLGELSGLDELPGSGESSGRAKRVREFAGDEGQRLDLGAWLGEPRQDVAVYCCGPDRLLAEVRARCAAWPRHALQTERFAPAAAPAVASVLSSCRRGLCGTCEVTVLDGRPDHRDSLLDDDERAGGDSMFICVSRSAGGRLVLDL